ncbi:WD40 repeat-like protein [Suillus weaverae]|nr:WD40 repeat-like protein [Suillus weaverae]
MASTSTKAVGTTKSILELVTTLEGHEEEIQSISYFPNGQRMISGSLDYTTRQWDLKAGKEIEEAQEFYEEHVHAVAVSRDGRWVVTGGGSYDSSELNACEVETGIVKTFGSHSHHISCIDISADATLLASGAMDCTTRIWNLDTGKLVAGPFEAVDSIGAVRFSTDSKKLAVKSWTGGCLDVWDIKTQMLDVRVGRRLGVRPTHAPVFWAKEGATIIAAFTFGDVGGTARTIYEFDASTLETVGAPFEGHTKHVNYLALSSDGALLASVAQDNTLKLWACESRQLLASFYVQNPRIIVLSPDSRQLVYATNTEDDHNIYICNTPPDVLQAQALTNARKKSTLSDLLNVLSSKVLFLFAPLTHHYHCSLMQLAVFLPSVVDNPYLSHLRRKDLRLQSTHSNLFSFASANFSNPLLVRTQYPISKFVIP